MIRGDIVPIDHVPPRPPIQIGPSNAAAKIIGPETTAEVCARLQRQSDAARIWPIVVSTAQGS